MNESVLDEAFGGEVGARVWMRSLPCESGMAMSPIQRAKWNVAVLVELAENGEIILSASRAVDASVDFEIISVSPATAGLLAQPDSLVGASLREVLGADHRFEQLYAVCVRVAACGVDALPVSTHCSSHRGASILFRVARTPTGLRLTLSCPEAQKSESQAIDALQALLEPVHACHGKSLGGQVFRLPALLLPPAWSVAVPVGRPERYARDCI